MSLLDKILGRPLRSSEAAKEELGVLTGVPALGLDALSSTAYLSKPSCLNQVSLLTIMTPY
jgi:hypothetical protein